MASTPYFPFFYRDFIHGTQFFTNAMVGCYVRLLCVQWDQGVIETEVFEAINDELTEKQTQKIQDKFLEVSNRYGKGFQNKRMEATRNYVSSLSKKRSNAGKLGGRPKGKQTDKQNESKQESKPEAKENHPNPNPNPNPKPKTKDKDKDILGTKFEEFWSLVPSRNGKRKFKPKAWENFQKIKVEELDLVLQATRNFADSEDVKRNFGIMDPHRFLHSIENRCDPWRDWIEPERPLAKMSKTERNAQSLLEKLKAGRQPTIVNP